MNPQSTRPQQQSQSQSSQSSDNRDDPRKAPAETGEPPMKIPEQQNGKDGRTPDADIQGEGNYDAARRYDQSAEKFAKSGQVEQAARDAAPKTEQDRQALTDAEAQGKQHAKR